MIENAKEYHLIQGLEEINSESLFLLMQSEDPRVIRFILESEALPGCLNCIEIGSELTKTVCFCSFSGQLLA